MKDYLLKSLNKQSLIEIIKKKEIIIGKLVEYIEQFDFDYLDETYNHSTREILENLLDIVKGEDDNEKINQKGQEI